MFARLFSSRAGYLFRTFVTDRVHTSKKLIASGVLISGASLTQMRSFADAAKPSIEVTEPLIYQYQICPFCHRVKAYLDYLKVDYKVVEVNPLTKSEISFSKEHKKVPIAIIDGNTIPDSKNIINILTEKYDAKKNPNFFTSDSDEWMEWSEKKLAVMLYPNITRSFDESWECFEYSLSVPTWNPIERQVVRASGAVAMFFANGKIKKKYNIQDERKELNELLLTWTNALGDKKYLHGNSITFPDLMVYGVLRAIKGFKTFNEIMQENPILKKWYDNVALEVVSHEKK